MKSGSRESSNGPSALIRRAIRSCSTFRAASGRKDHRTVRSLIRDRPTPFANHQRRAQGLVRKGEPGEVLIPLTLPQGAFTTSHPRVSMVSRLVPYIGPSSPFQSPLLSPCREDLGEMWGTAEEGSEVLPHRRHPDSRWTIPDAVRAVLKYFRTADSQSVPGVVTSILSKVPSRPRQRRNIIFSRVVRMRFLDWPGKDGAMTATQFGEVTRISDTDGDEVADRYDTLSNNWGYAARVTSSLSVPNTIPEGKHLGGAGFKRFLQIEQLCSAAGP